MIENHLTKSLLFCYSCREIGMAHNENITLQRLKNCLYLHGLYNVIKDKKR